MLKATVSLLLLLFPGLASAHASEQSLAMLLPTDAYIATGWIAVALSAIALMLFPATTTLPLLNSIGLSKQARSTHATSSNAPTAGHNNPIPDAVATAHDKDSDPGRHWTHRAALLVLICLLIIGFVGTHDPLENLLPLTIWSLWWVGFVFLTGVIGNLWRYTNPWVGLYGLLFNTTRWRAPLELPGSLSAWPAVALLILFATFLLADPAPDNPVRLAWVIVIYSAVTIGGMAMFGRTTWLCRVEFFSVLLFWYSRLGPVARVKGQWRIGLPGWRVMSHLNAPSSNLPVMSTSMAVFILALLGCGSFDGLNETFWWLSHIGVNPLEFPGRSAVIVQTVAGILLANALLIAVFAACIALGRWLVLKDTVQPHLNPRFMTAFCRSAVSVLPIAFAYHAAHYLPSFLVSSQYALVALSDPLATGADYLGLGKYFVSTGFFNALQSVRIIWLSQAALVVVGHILAVLLAHVIATELYGSRWRTLLGLLPLTVFMTIYTFIGLWLLAAPRGA